MDVIVFFPAILVSRFFYQGDYFKQIALVMRLSSHKFWSQSVDTECMSIT